MVYLVSLVCLCLGPYLYFLVVVRSCFGLVICSHLRFTVIASGQDMKVVISGVFNVLAAGDPCYDPDFRVISSDLKLTVVIAPPEATNTGPGFNRGSGGGARGYPGVWLRRTGRGIQYALTEGVISYCPRCLSV